MEIAMLHDVKVIFDPVTYVVFHGIGVGRLREIVLDKSALL
jgi:predicted Holliday junction resolvase-like endonuclease